MSQNCLGKSVINESEHWRLIMFILHETSKKFAEIEYCHVDRMFEILF